MEFELSEARQYNLSLKKNNPERSVKLYPNTNSTLDPYNMYVLMVNSCVIERRELQLDSPRTGPCNCRPISLRSRPCRFNEGVPVHAHLEMTLLVSTWLSTSIHRDSSFNVMAPFLRSLVVAIARACQSRCRSCHRNDPGDGGSISSQEKTSANKSLVLFP